MGAFRGVSRAGEARDPVAEGVCWLVPRQLRAPAAAAALATALLIGSCADSPTRTAAPAPTLDLATADIATLHAAMGEGRLTAEALTAAALDRIGELNTRLRAVLAVDPTAREQAVASDRHRASGAPPRPLEGIPVLVKDNISTGPVQPTTAGSLALADSRPPESEASRRLRAAGAVMLGKTNLTEWASYRASRSSSGWSAVGGQTRNAHGEDRNPCGSSSGSAAAVAASLVPVAIGTETSGSIVCPAAANGVVGLKPTLGLVSRSGVVPFSKAQDTVGPITRNVLDAALVLSVLQGSDPHDPTTREADQHRMAATVPPTPLGGARIGVLRADTGGSEETDRGYAATLARLRAAGATLVEPVALPNESRALSAEDTALSTEFEHDLDAYLASPGVRGPRSLGELIAFNREHPVEEMTWFGQELFEGALARPGVADPAYRAARAEATDLARRDLDTALAAGGLDALITPSNGPAWTNDLHNGDHFIVTPAGPAAAAGYPVVTVPAAVEGGLPLGLSLVGGPWSEPRLLALALAIEDTLRARVPPPLPPALVTLR